VLGGGGQPALEHVEPSLTILDHVDELSLQQLTVEVGDGIFEWVFITLLAFALVASCFEPSAQNWNTVRRLLVTLVGVLECVGNVVLVRTLVNVQHPDVHGDCHRSLEFDSLPEGVPTEEWCGVGDLPHLDQTFAVKVGSGPESLFQVGCAVVLGEVLVPPEVDVVALLLRPEVHLQPEFLQGVVVVRPSVGKFNNDKFFETYNNSLLKTLLIQLGF